jgi:anti-sigma factor RsiW
VTSNDGTAPPVDLDLLADYLDDALPAGPAAMVAHRIETDPRWASAAERLRAATPTVTNVLRATTTEPMPDALFDRLLAALPDATPATAKVGDAAGADARGRDSEGPGDRDAPPARVISLQHRRRRSIWSDLAKVAATLIVLAGVGTGIGLGLQANNATKSSSGAATSAEGNASQGAAGGVVTEATGHDYGRELTAAPQADVRSTPNIQTPNTPGGAGEPGLKSAPVPPALGRLASGGLPNCLARVQDQFGATPQKADFATYAGTPAVVVTLSDGTVVAVGADCGLPGQGADVLATGR